MPFHYKVTTTLSSRVLRNLVLIASMAAIMNSCGLGPQGLDLSRWTERRFSFSEFELLFRIPGGQTPYSGRDSTVSYVDLYRDLTSDKSGIGVFNHMWDFDVGLWKGVMGNLHMTAGVSRKPDDYGKDLMSLQNLEEVIRLEFDRTYTLRNQRLRQEGQEKFIIIPPDIYRRIKINGHEWLVYGFKTFFDRTIYSTPLTPNHYVTVTLSFSDNSRGYKTTWRQEAQAVADKIVASLEIRE